MATLYLSKGHTYNTTQETVYSSWTTLYTNGNYSFTGRAHCTLGYTGSGIYSVSQIVFEMKRSSAFTNGTYSIGSTSASASNFKSNTFSSITTPMGKSFTIGGNDVGTSGSTIIKFGSSNSTVDTSTVELSQTKTASSTCNAQIALTYMTGTSESTRVTTSFQIKIQLTYTVAGTKCTLTYLKDDGSQYATPVVSTIRSTTTIKNGYTKSGYTDTDSGTYTVSFNSRGGSSVSDKEYAWSWRQPITYTFVDWGGYKPGSTYTFLDESKSLKASFAVGGGDRTWTYKTLGSLPTVYLKGYLPTNEWFYSDGTQATSSDQVKSSFTLKCKQWEAKQYKIKFHLDGGKMPEEYGKISDYTIDKTYGANTSVRMPPFTPTKVGYKFAGWSDQTGACTKLQPNAYATDEVYNMYNTEYTNKDVTMYAQWTYNYNTMKFNYYTVDNNGSTHKYTDTEQYNIDQTSYKKYSPDHVNEMAGDYVFLGWCNIMPDNFGWDGGGDPDQQGYHGIYTLSTSVPDEAKSPIEVDISKLKKLEDWGVTQQYYGVWSKTGKYLKINGEFKKVSGMFVKINGEWKVVTDAWVRQENSWIHEI